MEFLELYANSELHKVLSIDLKENMLSHAYLVVSKDNLLLDNFCMLGIKEIFCRESNAPCNKCVNCTKIEHGNMVDLEIYPKGDKNLIVDDIEEIVENSLVRPMESKYKVFWLKNFDECTTQGQNKILKTIEEPPQNVIFILTASNIGGVLPTILSRTKKVYEKELPFDTLNKFLLDKKINNSDIISHMSDGNLTRALKIAENKDALSIINLAINTLLNLKSSKDVLYFSSQILALKKDIPFFLDTLTSILRDIIVYGKSDNIYFKNFAKQYEILSKMYTAKMIEIIVLKINEINVKMEFNCNMTAIVDKLLLDILEVRFLWQK